jgi:hypothetical protein
MMCYQDILERTVNYLIEGEDYTCCSIALLQSNSIITIIIYIIIIIIIIIKMIYANSYSSNKNSSTNLSC